MPNKHSLIRTPSGVALQGTSNTSCYSEWCCSELPLLDNLVWIGARVVHLDLIPRDLDDLCRDSSLMTLAARFQSGTCRTAEKTCKGVITHLRSAVAFLFGQRRVLLAKSIGRSRLLSVIIGCSRPLPAALGRCRPLSTALGRSWPLSTAVGQYIGCSRPLSATLSRSRPFSAALGCPDTQLPVAAPGSERDSFQIECGREGTCSERLTSLTQCTGEQRPTARGNWTGWGDPPAPGDGWTGTHISECRRRLAGTPTDG